MEVGMFHEEAMNARHRKWQEMSPGKKALVIGGWTLVAAAVIALAALAVMLLWNRIMSGVLGLPALGFWEAFGLLILAKILFGGKGHSFFGRMRMRRAMRERMARRAEGEEGNID
jgi:hypothetical protein